LLTAAFAFVAVAGSNNPSPNSVESTNDVVNFFNIVISPMDYRIRELRPLCGNEYARGRVPRM